MKLRALELEQFRKFDRPIRIAGMDDGLNLVARPQRDGQVDAVRGAAGGSVRAPPLAGPDGQELPAGRPRGRVAARRPRSSRSTAGRYRIEKRFLRRPSAELALPDGRHLHGEAAEEALEALLGGGGRRPAGSGRRGAGRLEPDLGRPGPVLRPAGDRLGRARHVAIGAGRRGRRDSGRRSRRRADRPDGAKRCTSWSTRPGGRAAATRRPTTRARRSGSRSPISKPGMTSSSGI